MCIRPMTPQDIDRLRNDTEHHKRMMMFYRAKLEECHMQLHHTLAAIEGYYRATKDDQTKAQSDILDEVMSYALEQKG